MKHRQDDYVQFDHCFSFSSHSISILNINAIAGLSCWYKGGGNTMANPKPVGGIIY